MKHTPLLALAVLATLSAPAQDPVPEAKAPSEAKASTPAVKALDTPTAKTPDAPAKAPTPAAKALDTPTAKTPDAPAKAPTPAAKALDTPTAKTPDAPAKVPAPAVKTPASATKAPAPVAKTPTPVAKASDAIVPAAAIPPLEEDRSFYDRFIADKLSFGVSMSASSMDKTHVPYDPHQEANFLGNINRLDESDNNGIGVVARYEICPYLAFQFSNDLHAELGMWNNENESRDADFVLDGYTYELLLMLPIERLRLTPYIGLGYTDISCEIDYNGWWHYGWSAPADYDAYGKGSKEPRNGVMRWMEIEEPSSVFTFSAGLSLRVWRYARLDFFWRTMSFDDASIVFYRDVKGSRIDMRSGYVPLECTTYGGALRVVF